MTDAVVVARPGAFAQIRVQEPAGERTLSPPLRIGGEGAEVVVPGEITGVALEIDRREGVWVVQGSGSAPVRFDGRPLKESRDLRPGDVIGVGEAHVIVLEASRTLLRLDVCHLVGNDTIAPVDAVASLSAEGDESGDDLEIRLLPGAVLGQRRAGTIEAPPAPASGASRWKVWSAAAAVLLALLALTILASFLEPVALDVLPAEARVRTPGTLISLRSGDRMLVLPGTHRFRAQMKGYAPAEAEVVVRENNTGSVKFRLAKLPGELNIDTSGVPVTVSVDGVEVGRAPGDIEVPPGSHTITLRAPRYLDYVTTLNIAGAGERQELKATLKPSWGTLSISSVPANARVSIDGADRGVAPTSLEVDAGVRRVQLSAPGLKAWESTVVVRSGETLKVGPITLGQPDTRLTVQSQPAGADVSVAGTLRGRTPVTIDMPSGVAHEVVVSLPGHTHWQRSVFAEPGRPLTLDARLEPILASVSIQGEPADAEIFIDGTSRGRAPRTLKLTTVEHRVEIRKPGFVPFTTTVVPATGLERAVQYRLTSADRTQALMESAPTITSKTGYVLNLVPGGKFAMGSDRREQGRRPNESLRQVTLQRPFYMGATEVTNALFRKYRPDHTSGYVGKRSFDLDNQPVTRVSWEEAAEFCNWLSEQDGLPPAYERSGTTYVLKRPVTTGYRLPTEAEWEYAARYVAPSRFRRFAWGDELPVAPQAGNLAGGEAATSLPAVLQGYQDEFPVIAPVGKFPPNPLGLFDMTGNVTEWVNDHYLSFVDNTAATDPLGPEQSSRHVVRGANWQSAVVAELRLAWRDGANEGSQTIGFRVARYAE